MGTQEPPGAPWGGSPGGPRVQAGQGRREASETCASRLKRAAPADGAAADPPLGHLQRRPGHVHDLAFGILGIYFLTSLYLPGILGFSPTKAGLAFVPLALCLAVAAVLSPREAALLGGHRTVALGMAVMAVGLVLFAGIGASATFTSLLAGFICSASGPG